MKKRTFREWVSTYIAKKPRTMILLGIFVFNLLFVIFAAIVISYLSPPSLRGRGFGASLFYTVTMILDTGSIHEVIRRTSAASTIATLVCLVVVIIGMLAFTGAIIGYVTNYISNFIDNVNAGKRKLRISDHTVIINWNSRASEIINELLYSEKREKVVVLVDDDTSLIEREIRERIEDSLERDKKELEFECEELGFIESIKHKHKYKVRNRLTVIVRNGDAYSSKQLSDISIKRAKAVMILSKDLYRDTYYCKGSDNTKKYEKGNADTVKSLVQAAHKVGKADSADNQKLIVEVEDDWTMGLVNTIINHKSVKGKSSIVPVLINKVLGQILAQFSIMPDLNKVFDILLSNKDAEFYCKKVERGNKSEKELISDYMSNHRHAVPVSYIDDKHNSKGSLYYVTDIEKDINRVDSVTDKEIDISYNESFSFKKKNIIILGHNSKSSYLMKSYNSFLDEWNGGVKEGLIKIHVIDDKEHLDKMDYDKYPYVSETLEADIYDKDLVLSKIKDIIKEANEKDEDISILILSDDEVKKEDMDTNALTYLVYVQDILTGKNKAKELENFKGRIDIVVEILNPKNYDVVHHYSVDNVVISNKYISKLITQIGEKDELYKLYEDMLTYDENKVDADSDKYKSKEMYIRDVSDVFVDGFIPEETSADNLIRSVYNQAPKNIKPVILGYIDKYGKVNFFAGEDLRKNVKLTSEDKLIIYSNH